MPLFGLSLSYQTKSIECELGTDGEMSGSEETDELQADVRVGSSVGLLRGRYCEGEAIVAAPSSLDERGYESRSDGKARPG